MSAITSVRRHVRTVTRRRSRERALVDLHPAVRDEVLTRWESQAR